jgi:phage major head subunit gpT-like protein
MTTQTNTVEIPVLRRRAQFIPSSFNEENRTIEVTWTTGEDVIEFDPFPGPFIERLSFEPDHVDLKRFKEGTAPVLDTHGMVVKAQGKPENLPKLKDIIGVVEDAWIEHASTVPGESDARARVRFSKRESLAELRQDIADGIVANVSVSYKVLRYRDITGPGDRLPVKLAVLWQPFEISFVPSGEDSGSRSRAAKPTTYTCTIEDPTTGDIMAAKTKGNGSSPNDSATNQAANGPDPVAVERQRGLDIRKAVKTAGVEDDYADELIELEEDGAAITVDRARTLVLSRLAATREAAANEESGDQFPGDTTTPADTSPAAVRAERSRGIEIRKAVSLAGLDGEYADELIGTNNRGGQPLSLDRCRALIIDKLAEEAQEPGHMNGGHTTTTVGMGSLDRCRTGIQNALENRCGVHADGTGKIVGVSAEGRDFSGMRLDRMAEEYFTQAGMGKRVRGLSPDRMAEFTLIRSRAISGGHGTTDFSSILANVADKRLRQAYDASPSGWKAIATRSSATDYKPMSRVQLGEYPALTKVLPGAEYEKGTIGESGETYSIAKYGKRIAFTREAMANDDLSAFDRLPQLAGRAAMELENDLAWAIITDNAAMGDGTALFHADHGNLETGGGSALASAGLTAARLAMRLQTGINGQRIGVTPRWLIVPAALETEAQELTTNFNPVTSGGVNPFMSAFEGIIVEPRLDADSATAWYVAAAPAQLDVLEYAYLQGNDGPMIETREGFEVDGLEMKVRHEFGVAALDHRGILKNDGA